MLTADDIICYIPTYNDEDALRRCLSKLKKLGITALVGDGRFTDFPQINGSDHSTDGTVELAKSFGAHYFQHKPMREQDKFNMALDIAKKLDYEVFMYCGSDAYFEGNIDEFLLSLQRYYEQYAVEPSQLLVWTEEKQPEAKWNNTGSRQPRVILNYWKMEARYLHWTMFEKGSPDSQPLAPVGDLLDGIKLIHDNSVRPKERDDMMTKYQDINVPRERQMFLDNIVPKAYDEVNILVWKHSDGSYEDARHAFFHTEENYSHLIMLSEGTELTEDKLDQFKDILGKRNNMMQQLPIISAVWASRTVKGNFTLNPDGRIQSKWPKYPKIEQLYSPDGLPMEGDPVMVAPYTAGPAVCMNRRVVEMLEHMGDPLDFLAILLGLGIQIHADARIQF